MISVGNVSPVTNLSGDMRRLTRQSDFRGKRGNESTINSVERDAAMSMQITFSTFVEVVTCLLISLYPMINHWLANQCSHSTL